MAPDTFNERVAALEPRVNTNEKDIMELRGFKDEMLKEITMLKGSINLLAWKVGLITGVFLLVVSQVIPWLFTKILR